MLNSENCCHESIVYSVKLGSVGLFRCINCYCTLRCLHCDYFSLSIESLFSGADKLVRHLHKHKIPLAMVTGSNDRSYKLKCIKHKEFFDLFDHAVISGSDPEVKRGKPAPDGFLLAAKRFPVEPEHSRVSVA